MKKLSDIYILVLLLCSSFTLQAQISDAEKNNLPRQRVQVEITTSKPKLVPDLITAPSIIVSQQGSPANRMNNLAGTFRVRANQEAVFTNREGQVLLGMAIPKNQSLKHLNGQQLNLNWLDREQELKQTHKALRLSNGKKEAVLIYREQVLNKPHAIQIAKGVVITQNRMNPQKGIQPAEVVLKIKNDEKKIELKKWQQFRSGDKTFLVYVQNSGYYPENVMNGGCETAGYALKAIVLVKETSS